jgi:hypothetical protein
MGRRETRRLAICDETELIVAVSDGQRQLKDDCIRGKIRSSTTAAIAAWGTVAIGGFRKKVSGTGKGQSCGVETFIATGGPAILHLG